MRPAFQRSHYVIAAFIGVVGAVCAAIAGSWVFTAILAAFVLANLVVLGRWNRWPRRPST